MPILKSCFTLPAIALAIVAIMPNKATAAEAGRVFEMRTYHCYPGKLEALKTRFREHTTKIFEKHGMTNVAYWTFQDEPDRSNTLIYVIAHESREQAKKNWEAFRNDPEWQQVQAASEANGKLVEKVDSVFLEATDFSPLK